MSDENKEPMVDHKNGTTQLSDQELDAVVGGDDNSTFLYFVSDALRMMSDMSKTVIANVRV
jgi:hypothetical protein